MQPPPVPPFRRPGPPGPPGAPGGLGMVRPPAAPSARPQGAPAGGDDAIRATDDDAALSRISAVQVGYLEDPFASVVYKLKLGERAKKAPLINVGTHHRTWALDTVIDSFTRGQAKAQIVSLGAGSDTRFWRMKSKPSECELKYVEVDFPHLTAAKAQRVARNRHLAEALGPGPKPYTVAHGGTALHSPSYDLVPVDLRNIAALEAELAPLLDTSVPTLLISECVFCYMTPAQGDAVMKWFLERFPQAAVVAYEMVGLNDAFGRVMKRNLAARNLSLPGAMDSQDAYAERLRGLGYEDAGAKSLWEVRESIVPKEELARISKLQILDEIEELRLVLSHYCVVWASRGMSGVGL